VSIKVPSRSKITARRFTGKAADACPITLA
jgi:hypothetical protein